MKPRGQPTFKAIGVYAAVGWGVGGDLLLQYRKDVSDTEIGHKLQPLTGSAVFRGRL
jgi:hypothetical protein